MLPYTSEPMTAQFKMAPKIKVKLIHNVYRSVELLSALKNVPKSLSTMFFLKITLNQRNTKKICKETSANKF